jgi:type I site-specific restriction endonuclease
MQHDTAAKFQMPRLCHSKYFSASYLTALDELGVPHEHRAHLIHHALKGSALDLYHETLQGKVTQLAEMFSALQEKFLNESVKLGIRAKLISLRLGYIQIAGNYTKVEAIEAVKKTVCAMCQLGQDEYKTDAAMIDVLERHVLLGEMWSADIAARRATHGLPLIVTAQCRTF